MKWSHPSRALVLTVLVLVVVPGAAMLSGCGGSAGKPLVADSDIPASVYSSTDYGYRFTFPSNCKLLRAKPSSSSPGLADSVAVADPEGAVVDGTALDVFSVSVYQLRPAAGPDVLAKHAAEFSRMALGFAKMESPDAKIVSAPSRTVFAGAQALTLEYFQGAGAREVGVVAYLVPKGERVYWVQLQTSRSTRGKTTLVLALKQFRFQ